MSLLGVPHSEKRRAPVVGLGPVPLTRLLSERGVTANGHDGAAMSPHSYPSTSQASGPDSAILPPRSESSLVHWLAFRLVDGCRKWRVVV